MAEAATAHALKLGDVAVLAEEHQQAHNKQLEATLSAHSAEIERVTKVRSSLAQQPLILHVIPTLFSDAFN